MTLLSFIRKAFGSSFLRFKATNDVIAYFEDQVRKSKQELNKEEDDLMYYNVREQVINYGEETKALAGTRYEVDDRFTIIAYRNSNA